jgi:hypothetical protein
MFDKTLALCDLIAEQLDLEHSTDSLALCERIVADVEARAKAQRAWLRYAGAVKAARKAA